MRCSLLFVFGALSLISTGASANKAHKNVDIYNCSSSTSAITVEVKFIQNRQWYRSYSDDMSAGSSDQLHCGACNIIIRADSGSQDHKYNYEHKNLYVLVSTSGVSSGHNSSICD